MRYSSLGGHRLAVKRRFQVSFLEASALFMLGALSLTVSMRGQGWLSRPSSKSLEFLTENDPQLGDVVFRNSVDLNGKPIPQDRDLLLILLGECNSCSLRAFDLHRLQTTSYAVVLVGQAPPAELKKSFGSEPSIWCVSDPEGRLATQLNMCFRPRSYVVRAGRLIWAASDPDEYPPGVSYE